MNNLLNKEERMSELSKQCLTVISEKCESRILREDEIEYQKVAYELMQSNHELKMQDMLISHLGHLLDQQMKTLMEQEKRKQQLETDINTLEHFEKENQHLLPKAAENLFCELQKLNEAEEQSLAEQRLIEQELCNKIEENVLFISECNKNIALAKDLEKKKEREKENLEQKIKSIEEEARKIEEIYINSKEEIEELLYTTRKLSNDLQELRGTIRVYCRIKPSKEKAIVEKTSENTVTLSVTRKNLRSVVEKMNHTFTFEHIYEENEEQEMIFLELSQFIMGVLDGKNVCIFAYGQTGSGKTFTMQGDIRDPSLHGIIPRSLEMIFDHINPVSPIGEVHISITEIYIDSKINLLNEFEVLVRNAEEALELINKANTVRKVAATKCNDRSSRSHLIVRVTVHMFGSLSSPEHTATLVLVDLAGSERIKESQVEGEALKEARAINTSLSHLGMIIAALKKKSPHIPYRNNILTHELQPQLEGGSRVLMFVNVSPDPIDSEHTLTILRFAESVRECKVTKNEEHKKN